MIEVTNIIEQFRKILLNSWDSIEILSTYTNDNAFHDAFIEVVWELSLEYGITASVEEHVFISHYGGGSEYFGDIGRATFPFAKTTHEIFCLPKEGDTLFDFYNNETISLTKKSDFSFYKFVTPGNREGDKILGFRYVEIPPFDYFWCQIDKGRRVFKVEDCNFYLKKLEDTEKQITYKIE